MIKRKSAAFEDLVVLLVFPPITANKRLALKIHVSVCFVELCSISFGPTLNTASSVIWWVKTDYTGSPNRNLAKQIMHKLSNVNAGCVHVSMFVSAPCVYFKS